MAVAMSFKDCPIKCNANGQVFDRNLGKFVQCDYCKERRKKLAVEGVAEDRNSSKGVSLHEQLGFKDKYLSSVYSFDALFPSEERALLEDETLEITREAIASLRGVLSGGDLPQYSMCFGLARKGSLDKLAYPMMVLAYNNGMSSLLYSSARLYYDDYVNERNLSKYHNIQLLFMLLPSGMGYSEVACVRGMMEARATLGYPTIFLTNGNIDEVRHLLGYVNEPSLYLASPYFIERVVSADSHSFYTDKLRGRVGVSLGEVKPL